MSSFGFDVGNTKAQVAFDPLPPGWYAMRVNKAEVVEGKNASTGQMLKIEFEIIEHAHPDYANRRAWTNLCHHHEKKETREIARSQIKAICDAIGKPNATSPTDMLGCELRVKLTAKPAENGFEARNECKGFKGLSEVEEAPKPAAASTPSAPAGAPRQPWKKQG